MWTPTCLILCLCLLGCSALVENQESEDEKLSDFYNLLDAVDDSNLGDVENVINGDGDDEDDVMLVDPPALMEEDLPAVQLEDVDDDDDDVADVDTSMGRRKGGRTQFWKKAKKWAKKLEKGKPKGQRRRGWGKEAWRRMEDSDSAITGSQARPAIKDHEVGKAGRRRGGRGGKFRSKMAEMELEPEVEDDDDDDDDEVKGDRRGGKHHAGKWSPHHRRGKHHRKGPHHHRGPPNHHRRGSHHRRGQHGWGQAAPLEKRVAMICWKLEKPQHERYLQVIHEQLNKGVGNADRRTYRIQFVDKMKDCCKNNVTREECFVSLTHERYDNFCDNQMPLKPWAPAGRKHKNAAVLFSSTCCEHAGEMRYNCFNGSKHASNTMDDTVSTEVPEIEEIIEDPLEEVEDDDEWTEEEAPTEAGRQVGRRGRKHGRGRGVVPPKVKADCCQAGKKGAAHIRGQRARATCFAAGRKFAMYRKEFKMACGMTFGRCCIHTVRHGETPEGTEGPEPSTPVYDYTEGDDDWDDDVSEKLDVERPHPAQPEVMKHPGMHHDGKHKKHHQQKEKDLIFYK